jgi:hypothetical protein
MQAPSSISAGGAQARERLFESDAASDFPLLRRALRRARAASARAESAAEWNEAQEAVATRTWSRAQQAYADGMLQRILDCHWSLTSAVSSNTGRAYPRTVDDLPLVSVFAQLLGGKPLVFSRRGRLPLSAATTAFVAESAVFDDRDGSVLPRALEQAAQLAGHGYGVWARADLTQFQSPDRALLIAAARLTADRAPAFGFTALADAAFG